MSKLNNRKKYETLLTLLKNKSAVVVGSGASLLGKKLGSTIDKHDIVLRINRGIPYKRYQEDVGSRTDIVSWGMGGCDEARYKVFNTLKDEARFFIYHWWDRSWIPKDIESSNKHVFIPDIYSRKLAAACGNKPATTGVECVNFLSLVANCSFITVVGIDFYKSGYWFIEEDGSIQPTVVSKTGVAAHDRDKEEEFFSSLVSSKNNIRWVK